MATLSSFVRSNDMPMNAIPADILLEIADHLSCPSEVLHLYLTVRANNQLFVHPTSYSSLQE